MQLITSGTLVKVYEQESFAQNCVKQRVTIKKEAPSHPAGIGDDYYDLYVYDHKISSDFLKALLGQKVRLEIKIDSYPVRPRGQQYYKNITVLNLKSIALC
jgi:hypothetical protein